MPDLIRTILLAAALSGAGIAVAQTPPLDVADPSITKKPTLDVRNSPTPEYPESPIHLEQGEATLSLCIDASGRVTSYTLKQSTGHQVLDDATVRFVKKARFTPAEVSGKAVAVCNHGYIQIWSIGR